MWKDKEKPKAAAAKKKRANKSQFCSAPKEGASDRIEEISRGADEWKWNALFLKRKVETVERRDVGI